MVAATKKALDEVEREYRWHYSEVYGTGSGSLDAGHTPPHESDATGRQGISAMERSGTVREIGQALVRMRGVAQELAKRLRARPELVERPDKYGPTISPLEYDRLREAQIRREQRGEGWGRG